LSLAADLPAALHILDEVGAEPWEYPGLHGHAAMVADFFRDVAPRQTEAKHGVRIARPIGNPTRLTTGLYATALASWQSDSAAVQTALGRAGMRIREATPTPQAPITTSAGTLQVAPSGVCARNEILETADKLQLGVQGEPLAPPSWLTELINGLVVLRLSVHRTSPRCERLTSSGPLASGWPRNFERDHGGFPERPQKATTRV
jgi:hypothetical protein